MANRQVQPYETWSLDLLKEELRKRKSRVSGKKKDLVTRLQSLDIMQRPCVDMEVEYNISLPSPSSYKDIHGSSQVPSLPMKRVVDFLSTQEKQFEDKFKAMYEQRYVRYMRMACEVDRDLVFFTASVWAEMKKSVAYKVDIALASNQVVDEAQCECAAGQGPSATCKHVATVLYGIHRFQEDGDIVTEKTCTQQLQTFHRSRPYKGSPMKSSDIASIRHQSHVSYDPRPEHFRNQAGYGDHFRNTVINFQQGESG